MLTMVKITNKTPERCHAVFIFNFEHVQMNLFFSFFCNFEYIFVSWKLDKTHKTS